MKLVTLLTCLIAVALATTGFAAPRHHHHRHHRHHRHHGHRHHHAMNMTVHTHHWAMRGHTRHRVMGTIAEAPIRFVENQVHLDHARDAVIVDNGTHSFNDRIGTQPVASVINHRASAAEEAGTRQAFYNFINNNFKTNELLPDLSRKAFDDPIFEHVRANQFGIKYEDRKPIFTPEEARRHAQFLEELQVMEIRAWNNEQEYRRTHTEAR